MKKSQLREMTVTELRQIVRDQDLQIIGAWKMKKDDLIEEIFAEVMEAWEMEDDENSTEEITIVAIKEELKPEIEETEEKPSQEKPNRFALLNENDEIVEEFRTKTEAINYCKSNGISNGGWVKRSLDTGERFYNVNGKIKKSSKYTGVNYKMKAL